MEEWEEDVNVRVALDWFLGFIESSEWNRRRSTAEDYLRSLSHISVFKEVQLRGDKIRSPQDRFGWYLTLAETYLTRPDFFDHTQGSRVIPIFSLIGRDIDLLKQIAGIEERARRLTLGERENPDSGLFELLVGAAYIRSGWSDVAFISESPPKKTPDLSIKKRGVKKRFIECKRLSMVSEYHRNERKMWLNMWPPLSEFLWRSELPLLLEITFHVELRHLNDQFLYKELLPKLKFVVSPGVIIDNDTWRVTVRMIDLSDLSEKFEHRYYKVNSSSLRFLLTGQDIQSDKGFTTIIDGHLEGQYFDSIKYAAGAIWSCDSEAAIRTKARDIRSQLSKAMTQLPTGERGIVHVGLETLEGSLVEGERMRRIVNTVFNFNTFGKQLDWIYCHLFGASVPPDQNWLFDETVFTFPRSRRLVPPLKPPFLIASDEETFRSGVHW